MGMPGLKKGISLHHDGAHADVWRSRDRRGHLIGAPTGCIEVGQGRARRSALEVGVRGEEMESSSQRRSLDLPAKLRAGMKGSAKGDRTLEALGTAGACAVAAGAGAGAASGRLEGLGLREVILLMS